MDADGTTAARLVDPSEVDLDSAAFASRFANLLAHHRRSSGDRLQTLARRSNGRFTVRQLRAFEAGQGAAVDAAEVAALYGADLATILPARLPLEVDAAGRVSTAGVSEAFGAGDDDALLVAYLRLIRRLRHQQRAEMIDVRRDDVEVLAATLDLPGETVVDRLGQLMGATRVERRIMVGMFVAGAAIIGLTVTTVAATSGGSSNGDTSAPTSDPPAASAETTVASTTTVGDLPTEPPVRPRPQGTPLPSVPLHQTMAFLDANGAFLSMPDTIAAPPPPADAPETDPATDEPAPPATTSPGAAPSPPAATSPPATAPPATPAPTTTDVATGPPPVPTTEAPIVEPPPNTAPSTTAPAPTTTEPEVATGPPPVPPTTAPIP